MMGKLLVYMIIHIDIIQSAPLSESNGSKFLSNFGITSYSKLQKNKLRLILLEIRALSNNKYLTYIFRRVPSKGCKKTTEAIGYQVQCSVNPIHNSHEEQS